MIYPTAKTKEEWSKWYNAQGYGVKTTYGYHEGADINLRTGGNSDLGKPLYAIADGEITSVCETHATKAFGRHLHLKITGAWGVRWAHYCHCQKILVKVGQKVKEGDQIALLGNSGTEYTHLHFAIKNSATGIEGIAKTKEQLKSWDDPIAFIEKHLGVTEEPMNFLDINADIPTWAEAELGLKAYEWYNTKWSIADMVKYLDSTYKNLKATKQDMAKLENSFADERNQLEDTIENQKEDLELHQQANSRLNSENDSLKKQIAVLEEENKLWNALKRAVSSLLRR